MRRFAWIVALVLASAAALMALLIALVPRDALRARVGEQIASWTGRDVSLLGEPEISVFPRLTVTLKDVHIGGPPDMADSEILSMDRLTGTVQLLPLIIGRIEVGSFVMVRPLIRLVRDQAGRRNWDFDSGAAALQLAFAGDVPLGDFRLEGGTVVYEDRQKRESERLDSVDLRVDWPTVRQPLSVKGSGIWRGEQVGVSATASAPFAFLNGSATPLDARIESNPASIIFSGQAEDYPQPKLNGGLKLSTPSLRRFAAWLGSAIGPGSTLGQASGFGDASFSNSKLSIENAELTLDGNAASGALRMEFLPKLQIVGTLAFETLDLSPYFAGLSNAIGAASNWRGVPLPTAWFDDMNADIRFSAGTVSLGRLSVADAAASASMRDGRLEVGLAHAGLSGGVISGDLALSRLPKSPESTLEVQLRANNIAFAGAPPTLGLQGPVSGTGFVSLDVSTRGVDLGSLLAELNGTARLSLTDGKVPLFGLGEAVAGATGTPDRSSGDILAAQPVQSVALGFNFAGGLAMLERGRVVTENYAADIQGWIGLLDGTLGLNGTVDRPPMTGDTLDEPLRFTIGGTLAAPLPGES